MHQNACPPVCRPKVPALKNTWALVPLALGGVSKMRAIFLRVCGNIFSHPEGFCGGVEVFLQVREAKTKKCAILWTPNVTAMPAWQGRLINLGHSKYMKR